MGVYIGLTIHSTETTPCSDLGQNHSSDELYIELFNLLLEKQSATYRRIESFEKPENMSTGLILTAACPIRKSPGNLIHS
jgi:hypothetical protein